MTCAGQLTLQIIQFFQYQLYKSCYIRKKVTCMGHIISQLRGCNEEAKTCQQVQTVHIHMKQKKKKIEELSYITNANNSLLNDQKLKLRLTCIFYFSMCCIWRMKVGLGLLAPNRYEIDLSNEVLNNHFVQGAQAKVHQYF